MQCPSCQVAFHDKDDNWKWCNMSSSDDQAHVWACSITECPACYAPIVKLEDFERFSGNLITSELIFPYSPAPAIHVSSSVPTSMSTDYIEATKVLPISPKASAALSRRILQSILKEQGYFDRDLAKQVDAVLNEKDTSKVLPLAIRGKIDAIRNFGNFSAHPITDLTTLQVIDVEPQEAEWCLEIVSDLFEHYYARPAEDARKLAELNQKLADAGKPPTK